MQLLLYTLQCDPSLRIRRAAMSLAQTVTVRLIRQARLHAGHPGKQTRRRLAVQVKSGSAAELHILEAVLLKCRCVPCCCDHQKRHCRGSWGIDQGWINCRDKDASVREMAFAMAKQFDPVHLARVTDWHMWRMILDVGLIGLEGIVAAGQVLQSGLSCSHCFTAS